jgi:hexokinase
MSLKEAAKKVEAEFDFTAEDVRKAVKEFLREMGTIDNANIQILRTNSALIDEGLEKDGQTLNQIPTYVTAVPNGSEEVSTLFSC